MKKQLFKVMGVGINEQIEVLYPDRDKLQDFRVGNSYLRYLTGEDAHLETVDLLTGNLQWRIQQPIEPVSIKTVLDAFRNIFPKSTHLVKSYSQDYGQNVLCLFRGEVPEFTLPDVPFTAVLQYGLAYQLQKPVNVWRKMAVAEVVDGEHLKEVVEERSEEDGQDI